MLTKKELMRIEKISIQPGARIIEALKKMDKYGVKLLILHEDFIFKGLLSIGDIQRALLKGISTEEKVNKILRKEFDVAKTSESKESLKQRMVISRDELMPILDNKNKLVDIVFWEDILPDTSFKREINIPVIIMAGGQGTRLQPITNIIPKPLLPYKRRTIIEEIIHRFAENGCREFYLSLREKGDMIISYLEGIDIQDNITIEYIKEEEPLGTCGSLKLIEDQLFSEFIISNCDTLINEDMTKVYDYHRANKNIMTIVSTLKNIYLPYGILETKENGLLEKIIEKPDYTFQLNSGVYIMDKRALQFISKNEVLSMDTLINRLKETGERVGVYPINAGSWEDFGNWEVYKEHFLRGINE